MLEINEMKEKRKEKKLSYKTRAGSFKIIIK